MTNVRTVAATSLLAGALLLAGSTSATAMHTDYHTCDPANPADDSGYLCLLVAVDDTATWDRAAGSTDCLTVDVFANDDARLVAFRELSVAIGDATVEEGPANAAGSPTAVVCPGPTLGADDSVQLVYSAINSRTRDKHYYGTDSTVAYANLTVGSGAPAEVAPVYDKPVAPAAAAGTTGAAAPEGAQEDVPASAPAPVAVDAASHPKAEASSSIGKTVLIGWLAALAVTIVGGGAYLLGRRKPTSK